MFSRVIRDKIRQFSPHISNSIEIIHEGFKGCSAIPIIFSVCLCVIGAESAYKDVPYENTTLTERNKPLLQCSLNWIKKSLRVLFAEDNLLEDVMYFMIVQSHTTLRYNRLGETFRFFQSHHRALSL